MIVPCRWGAVVVRRITQACVWTCLSLSGQAACAQVATTDNQAASTEQATGDMQARAWAYSCATCHGVEKSAVSGIPSLAGMPAQRLVALMQRFASDARPGLLMPQIAKGYDEATLWRIGHWYESQAPGDARGLSDKGGKP